MKKKITFQWGAEKNIKVSRVDHNDSLFYESYRQAMAGVAEIVIASNHYTSQKSGLSYLSPPGTADQTMEGSCWNASEYSPNEDIMFYNYPNNMILFSGERGAGKSSALLTFVRSLEKKQSKLFSDDFLQDMIQYELPTAMKDEVFTQLKSAHFCAIPPIDPTTLYGGHQILTVILSRIFRMAEDAWNNFENRFFGSSPERQKVIEKKNELLKLFDTCYKHINILSGNKNSDEEMDDLQLLDTIGDTVYLKRELAELIEKVLNFRFSTDKNAFMVIQIDDSDMNIAQAYEILENLRKYLVVPRVIIVMAADINQLTLLVEENFIKEVRIDGALSSFSELAYKLANQYITKLFPHTRQILLPSLSVYLKEHFQDIVIENYVLSEKNLPDSSKIYTDCQDQLFRLIYRKTGMIFLRTDGRLHHIIPDNMRLLSLLLSTLSQMVDVADPDKEDFGLFISFRGDTPIDEIQAHIEKLNLRLNNVQRFRDYFLNVWAHNNLSPEHMEIIFQLDQINTDNKVKYVYDTLRNIFSDTLAEGYETDNPETNGADISIDTKTIKYTHLLYLLDQMEAQICDASTQKFYFAVRQYFSFLGHCLMLRELISYYESMNRAIREKGKITIVYNTFNEGCTFLSLYPVFGSDAFITPRSKNTNRNWTAKIEAPKKNDDDNMISTLYPILSYLVSMLTDYEQMQGNVSGHSDNGITLDLNYSLANCLYINKNNPISKCAGKFFNGPGLSIIEVGPNWEKMQSSSLMALLNWDVLRVLRDTPEGTVPLNEEKPLSAAEKFSNLIVNIGDYYVHLANLFNEKNASPDPNNENEKTYKYPIQCLRSTKFDSWVAPVKTFSINKNDEIYAAVLSFFGHNNDGQNNKNSEE